MNMGSPVHQSTKTTQWTVDRLADQIYAISQINLLVKKWATNQLAKKSVKTVVFLLSWLPLILAILSVNESVIQSESKSVSLSVNLSWSCQSVSQ